MNEKKSPLATNMEKGRKRAGMTMQQAADVCGINQKNWQAYEYDRATPSPDVLLRIATGLGVKPEELHAFLSHPNFFHPRRKRAAGDPVGEKILQAYHRTTPHVRKAIDLLLRVADARGKVKAGA